MKCDPIIYYVFVHLDPSRSGNGNGIVQKHYS